MAIHLLIMHLFNFGEKIHYNFLQTWEATLVRKNIKGFKSSMSLSRTKMKVSRKAVRCGKIELVKRISNWITKEAKKWDNLPFQNRNFE